MARHSFSALATALTALPLAAQQAPSKVDQDVMELLDLLNTPIQGASKREQRLIDSPQAIEVLTGDEIRAMGIYKLADALKLMTSVDVLDLDHHVTNVTLRGASQQGQPKTVQILIDGVPLYNAEIAAVDVDNLPVPIDLVDKVEVVRGPSSSLYGANAVVGVIAITTKRAAEGLKGGARVSTATKQNVSKGKASFDTARGAAHLSLKTGGFGVVAGYQGASQHPTQRLATSLDSAALTRLDRDSSHQRHGFMRADWDYGQGSVWLGAGDAVKTLGFSSTTVLPYQTFNTRTVNAGWGAQWMKNFRTELRWSHVLEQNSFGGTPLLASLFGPEVAKEYTWSDYGSDLLEVQVNWDLLDWIHLVGGADHRKYTAGKSVIIGFPTAFNESASGGFLNFDLNLTDALALSLGARAENESIGGSRISPRFAFLWNPTRTASLRAGHYSSTRSPQVSEARVNFTNTFSVPSPPFPPGTVGIFRIVPNPDLNPEKVTSTELGYRQAFGTLTLDVTLFEMKFTRLIAQNLVGTQFVPGLPSRYFLFNQYVNTGEAKDRGLEVAATWKPSKEFSAGANATWIDFTLGDTDTRPTYTPAFKGNLWVRAAKGPYSGYAAFQHVGALDMEVLPVAGTPTPRTPRKPVNQLHVNLAVEVLPRATVALYSRNALKGYTDQGGGGPTRQAILQAARRETGLTFSYRF